MKYETVKDFVCDMLDNPGVVFGDGYGRKWMYENFQLKFKDLGSPEWASGSRCLHLYNTGISKET